MHKRIIKIIFICVTICAITFVSYADDLNELQDKKNEIQNKVTESEENLQIINGEITSNLEQIQKMDETIEQNQKTLDELNSGISDIEETIKKIEKNLRIVVKKYNKQKKLLDQRLVAMYEMKETRYLDMLLSSSSLTDFISTYYLVTELAEYDIDLLETVEQEKKTIEDNKNNYLIQKKNLEEKRNLQVKTKIALENSKLIRESYVAKLSEDEKKVQAQLDEYNAQVQSIENEIRSLAKIANFGEDYIGGDMKWPIDGHYTITSPYSMRVHPITKVYKLHTGIDISASMGTDFKAAAHGMVVKAEYNKAYGNMVLIDHGGGVQTLYAHGSSIEVQVGQVVNSGDIVLKVGSTGYSTGPHAHFEVRIKGEPVNPLDYVSIPGQEKSQDETQEQSQ